MPATAGGLPTLCLTLAELGVTALDVYGPPQTAALVGAFQEQDCLQRDTLRCVRPCMVLAQLCALTPGLALQTVIDLTRSA
eukprot:SAG11_NODE_9_length_28972_cov_81.532539_15_plen_81_part_00